MTDMLAVLLGAGGGKAAQVLAALGGKHPAKVPQSGDLALSEAGGEDPFMTVLNKRLGELQARVDSAPVPLEAEAHVDAAIAPPDAALSQAQVDPGQLAMQQALVLPGEPPSAAGLTAEGAAGLPAGEMSSGIPQAKGVPPGPLAAMSAQAKTSAGAAPDPASLSERTAESAVGGQSLPPDRADAGFSERIVRPEAGGGMETRQAMLSAGSVAQSLAAQTSSGVADAAGLAPAQSPQVLPVGAGGGAGPGGLGVMPEAARAQPAAMQLSIDAPVRSPQFPQELGERVVWLSTRLGQVAEIALNPPHLGPLEVRLALSGGEAGAQFYSPHATVRDAIEAALPRLREMMAEAGVTLGQAHVRDEAMPRQSGFAQAEGRSAAAPAEGEDAGSTRGPVAAGVVRRAGMGLVDLYI